MTETSILSSINVVGPTNKVEECAEFVIDDIRERFTISDVVIIGQEYTFSCWIKSASAGSITIADKTTDTYTAWRKHVVTFTPTDTSIHITYGVPGTYYLLRAKVELGNHATDWLPAPEDTEEEIGNAATSASNAQTSADTALDRIGAAETLIEQLETCISMLVTDGNGGSLMTQTKDGWTFNMAGTYDALDAVRGSLSELQNETGDTSRTVDILKNSVDGLTPITPYVRIVTDSGRPCIELGEGDTDFKLRITNTDIRFMEGSTVVAYINNQSLKITKAVIEEELQQGDFVWTVRSNGNLGLMWKGVSS